jgi:hypothetical protein
MSDESSLGEITSLVSVPITNCDVPDPTSIEAQFVYNFYVEGEDVDYAPEPTAPFDYADGLIDRENIDRIEAKERGALSARVPRYIRLRISKFLDGIEPLEEGELSRDLLELLVSQSGRSKGYSVESEVENEFNSRLSVVDVDVRQRVQSELYRIATSLIEAQSVTSEYSDQMIAMTLNGLMSDDIDASILMDALSDNEIKGYRFVNQITGKRYSRFDLKSSVRHLSKVSASGYRDLTTQVVSSNPFTSNFISDLLGSAAPPESRNWLLDPAVFPTYGGMDGEEVENLRSTLQVLSVSDARYVASRQAMINLGYPTIRHVGYVIEKVGTAPDGTQERFRDYVSVNPDVTEFIDPLVKYGYTYTYRARQLFIAQILQVDDSDTREGYKYRIVTAGIASSSPTPAVTRAVETIPPRPPGTLICSFIYKSGNGIRLDWARPTNPTRDIKKYQVFRRKSLLDPYQLIAEYDFTDPGYTQFDQRETVDPSLVRRSNIPVYSHVDREFNRESSYMYCVASIDAHGLSSGYGTQVMCTFERFSNALATRIISRSGAPKAYPNYYVDPTELEEFGSDRLVEDVIKDSGHGRMRLYFNPDAYRVGSDEDGSETQPIVLSSERGVYKFQIINLDRQESRVLTVNINKDSSLSGLI